MKQSLITIAAVLVALCVGIYAQQNSTNLPSQQGSTTLPEIILPDLSGKQRNISEWQGKVLVINFWATWCPPCLKEIPEFMALQDELGNQGLQFIGIAIEERETVVEYAKSRKINYPILIGEQSGIALSVAMGNSINAVPFSVIVDKQGKIIHTHPGELGKNQILEIVTPLL